MSMGRAGRLSPSARGSLFLLLRSDYRALYGSPRPRLTIRPCPKYNAIRWLINIKLAFFKY